ncbi:hypothetical protein RJ639_007681 [Escallonia herrerae]|uniref:N-acetyl-D-glucosamine kinase n=1 Tax=Escallonia herrerae TaxID=1293975 RepID=A0AA89AVL8_9ASTE|nr:hypothetical protein RJ639_007681 [Escallonia herrerae]
MRLAPPLRLDARLLLQASSSAANSLLPPVLFLGFSGNFVPELVRLVLFNPVVFPLVVELVGLCEAVAAQLFLDFFDDFDRETFPSHVKRYVQKDAVAALASGTFGKLHGCVLIAGTGSISYGFTEDGREARAASGVPVLGDWGSGRSANWRRGAAIAGLAPLVAEAAAAIAAELAKRSRRAALQQDSSRRLAQMGLGRCDGGESATGGDGLCDGEVRVGYGIAAQALTAVVRAHDGRGRQTMLTNSILKSIGRSSPDELIGWTYADPSWARIAALVPAVVSCAEAGDQIASGILNAAVEELALTVKAVVRRLGLGGEGCDNNVDNDGLAGDCCLRSLLVGLGTVMEEVVNSIDKLGGQHGCKFSSDPSAKVEPAVGAALLAWNFLMKETEGNCH